jgi:DNA-binding MarR family transcriptional regulator
MNQDKFLQAMQEWSSVFARRTIHDFMAFAHEHGVSMSQITVLLRLYYRGPTSILAVRQELYGSRAAASQLIDKLVQMGLVERSESTEDRRVKVIRLTDLGQRLVADGITARRQWLITLKTAFSQEEQEQFAIVLSRLSQEALAIEASEEPEVASEESEEA